MNILLGVLTSLFLLAGCGSDGDRVWTTPAVPDGDLTGLVYIDVEAMAESDDDFSEDVRVRGWFTISDRCEVGGACAEVSVTSAEERVWVWAEDVVVGVADSAEVGAGLLAVWSEMGSPPECFTTTRPTLFVTDDSARHLEIACTDTDANEAVGFAKLSYWIPDDETRLAVGLE